MAIHWAFILSTWFFMYCSLTLLGMLMWMFFSPIVSWVTAAFAAPFFLIPFTLRFLAAVRISNNFAYGFMVGIVWFTLSITADTLIYVGLLHDTFYYFFTGYQPWLTICYGGTLLSGLAAAVIYHWRNRAVG